MEKYKSLLLNIARKHGINKGKTESDIEWKTRIVYSICGMMAYASLWDEASEEDISIVHMKKRVRGILKGYREIYPELSSSICFNSEDLEEEIVNVFLQTGMIYHSPNRVAPASKKIASVNEVAFERGISPDEITCVSGWGFYRSKDYPDMGMEVNEMFGLEVDILEKVWASTIAKVTWKPASNLDSNTEYLRMIPPFSKGYWDNRPDRSGVISILRTGFKGSELYYLYRSKDNDLEISPIPSWQVDDYNYRSLSNACLAANKTLPPIEYTIDGELVHIRLGYLLPPRELYFLKLYSWPESCSSLPSDFKRKCTLKIFNAIQDILTALGYTFREEP